MVDAQDESDQRDLRVVLLLGCAAALAAVVGAYAAIVGDRGSDRWHQAIREDIRHGARIVSDARQLYQEDAPVGHRVAEYELRANALEGEAKDAAGAAAAILEAEAEAQRNTAEVLSSSSPLVEGDPKHAISLTGADLMDRFTEIRSEVSPELAALAPDEVEAKGSDEQRESSLLVATTLASGIAFLLGALAEALPRSRRRLTNAGLVAVGAGAVLAGLVVSI